MKQSNNKTIRSGFTLIELLVVIAIIGILAAFAFASFTSAQARARDAQRKNDLNQLKKALEFAKSDSTSASYYPDSTTQPSFGNAFPNGGTNSGGYMKKVPLDPKNTGTYVYAYVVTNPPAGVTITCTGTAWPAGGCNNYLLTTSLENTSDPAISPTNTSGTKCGVTTPATTTYYVCPD